MNKVILDWKQVFYTYRNANKQQNYFVISVVAALKKKKKKQPELKKLFRIKGK